MPFPVPTALFPLPAADASDTVLAAAAQIPQATNPDARPANTNTPADDGFLDMVILAVVVLWLSLFIWHRARKQRWAGQDREALFQQLCDLHQLSQFDRELLKIAAESAQLEQPGLAFVNPRVLLNYSEQNPKVADQARKLADRLFGDVLLQEIVQQSSV